MLESNKKMIYLASPHYHSAEGVRESRYYYACQCAAWAITTQNVLVFSPVAMSHGIAKTLKSTDSLDFNFWSEIDFRMIKLCDEFWILCISGWKRSIGIKAEAQLAFSENKPVKIIMTRDIMFPTGYKNCVEIETQYSIQPITEDWARETFIWS